MYYSIIILFSIINLIILFKTFWRGKNYVTWVDILFLGHIAVSTFVHHMTKVFTFACYYN